MATRSALIASDPKVEVVGQEVLHDTGSAMAAVVSAYFAAVGLLPGVLLSPLVLMSAVVGADVRVFDGRLRQPGAGAKRPRGHLQDQSPANAAFLAVPSGLQAALVALAYDKGTTLSRAAHAGVVAAHGIGATRRQAALERIEAAGASALSEPTLAYPLLAVGSASQGGMLTLTDLSKIWEVDQRARVIAQAGGEVEFGPPWSRDGVRIIADSALLVICAADAHGRFAGLSCEHALSGIDIDELELVAPRAAVPVKRGVPRVQPGSLLPSAVWLSVLATSAGVPQEIAGDLGNDHAGCARRPAIRQLASSRGVQISRL